MLGAALPSAVSCIGAGYGQWGREPPIGVGKLPAPVACCLLRWPVACSNAPFPLLCCLPRWPVACSNAPFPLLCRLPRWLVACPDAGPRLPGIARGWLRRPDGALSCEVRWLGPGLGQFCRRSRALEGEPRPSGWCSGCFACRPARTASRAPACRVDVRAVLHVVRDDGEAVNSPVGLVFGLFCMRSGVFKGMPSLCKCDNACEEWWRWESRAAVRDSPAAADADPGIAVKAAHGAERLGLCARGLRGTAGNWARCRFRIRGSGALQWAIAAEGTPVAGSR